MATIDQTAAIDADKLMTFVFRAVEEIGATLNTALVVMGDRLGLYRALAAAGPLTSDLAEQTGTTEHLPDRARLGARLTKDHRSGEDRCRHRLA